MRIDLGLWGFGRSVVPLLACAAPCAAQCATWSTAFTQAQSVDGEVTALSWFDDGSGPALYVGGRFFSAAGVSSPHVIRHDAQGWSALGVGVNDVVWGLAAFDDGSGPALYVAGAFTTAGGIPARGIARWNGSAWSNVGGGIDDGYAHTLAVLDDGSGPALWVAGEFQHVGGGIAASNVARWDGSSWTGLGPVPGLQSPTVFSMAAYDDGGGPALYVAGIYTYTLPPGPMLVPFLEQWRGGTWNNIGGGGPTTLCVYDSGNGPELYGGGLFSSSIGHNITRRSRTAGNTWVPLGVGTNSKVTSMTVFDDGAWPALFVCGDFTQAGGQNSQHIARWDGIHWSAVVGGLNNGVVNALQSAIDDARRVPDLYVGGYFGAAAGQPSLYLAEWFGCGNTGSALCFGDGTGTACPCGNNSAVGDDAGCLHSLGYPGKLTASGHASVTQDTFAIQATNLPPTATLLFFQGTLAVAGDVFGDGLRCAGGAVVRLAAKISVAGTSSYPESGDAPIHVRGSMTPGYEPLYQAWYRNSAAFCTPAGYNLTNAWTVTWHP